MKKVSPTHAGIMVFLCSIFLSFVISGITTALHLHMIGARKKRNLVIMSLLWALFFQILQIKFFPTGRYVYETEGYNINILLLYFFSIILGIWYAFIAFRECKKFNLEHSNEDSK
jgi:hypothetical protein